MKKVSNIKKLSTEQEIVSNLPIVVGATNSRTSFNSEAIYQYITNTESTTPLFNLAYGNIFYGRVKENNIPVVPLGSELKQILIVNNGPFCLPFVTDAYQDFFVVWSKYIQDGRVLDVPEFRLEAVGGYLALDELYGSHLANHYDIFLSYLQANNLSDKIKSFHDFLRIFSDYTSFNSYVNPISASSFVFSNKCNPFVSGMGISFSNQPINYQTKQDWIDHPNFQLYNEISNLYGFIVDKNVPWRLYFNVNSPASEIYINRYTTTDRIFNDFFVNVNEYDLFFLKKNIYDFYNQFQVDNPNFKITNYKFCNNKTITKTNLFTREVLDLSEVSRKVNHFSDPTWLRFYVFLRACEKKLNWNQQKFDRTVQEFIQLNSALDKNSALGYLERELAVAKTDTTVQISFLF